MIYNLSPAYDLVAIQSQTRKVSWLNIGDSKTTDASTDSNLGFGMQRVFRPARWGFRSGRVSMGMTAWGLGGNNVSSDATVTTRNPGATFTGALGLTQINPSPVVEWAFSLNRPDGSAVSFANAFMNGTADYGAGNALWASNDCYVRQAYHRSTQSIASFRLRAARNTGTDASPTYTTVNTGAVTANGALGWQFAEQSCGNGVGSPAVQVIENSIDESAAGANVLILGQRTFVRGTIGQPVVGFGISDNATGGHTAEQVAQSLGSTAFGTPLCTLENAAWFWKNIYMSPDIVHIDATQNQGSTSTELNLGDGSTFRTRLQAIIDAIRAICTFNNDPMPFVIIANGYESAYTELNRATRATVCYELATQCNGGFIDYSRVMATSPASSSWWTQDDIHPTSMGASVWAQALWSAMYGDYFGYNRGRSKPILRTMRR